LIDLEASLEDYRALLRLALPYMPKHGPMDNWECEHGFHLDECPNEGCGLASTSAFKQRYEQAMKGATA
jgi:hypothetical protein